MPDLAPKHVERIVDADQQGLLQRRRCSTASSTASWRRPAIRPATGIGRLRPARREAEFSSDATSSAAPSARRASQDPDTSTRSSSSSSPTPASSTASTRCSARSCRGMEFVDKIKKGDPQSTARCTTPTRSSPPRSSTSKETADWPITKTPRTPCSSRPPRDRWSSRCGPTSRPTTSRTSRSWRARASTTASCSTA